MDIHSHNAIKFWLLSERLSQNYIREAILFCVDTYTIELYVYFLAFERISLPARAILYYVFIFLYLIHRSYVEINSMSHELSHVSKKNTLHNIGNVASNYAMRQNLRVNRALIIRCAVKFIYVYILWIINLRIVLPAENVTLRRKCGTWVFVLIMKSVFILRNVRDYLRDSSYLKFYGFTIKLVRFYSVSYCITL